MSISKNKSSNPTQPALFLACTPENALKGGRGGGGAGQNLKEWLSSPAPVRLTEFRVKNGNLCLTRTNEASTVERIQISLLQMKYILFVGENAAKYR